MIVLIVLSMTISNLVKNLSGISYDFTLTYL